MKKISEKKLKELARDGKIDKYIPKRRPEKVVELPVEPAAEPPKEGTRILEVVEKAASVNTDLLNMLVKNLEGSSKPVVVNTMTPVLTWKFSFKRDARGNIQTVTAKGYTNG